MNGAGNKVGIETDPVSSQEQDCLSCSTVISSKVSTDPRQTHRTYCVVRFYSSSFPRALPRAWQVKRLLLRRSRKQSEEFHFKIKQFVNSPKGDNMKSYQIFLCMKFESITSITVSTRDAPIHIYPHS